jgi:hypothetical protein
MVEDNSKWMQDKRKRCPENQVTFNKAGWINIPEPVKIETFTTVNCNVMLACPFCLHQDKLSAFFVSTTTGISQSKACCPECHNGMLMKSLYNDWGAKEYADWVFDYRKSGFWKKCPFDKWKKRLHDIGWSIEFWARYKQLKGDDDADTIFDDAERMAKDYGIDMHDATV